MVFQLAPPEDLALELTAFTSAKLPMMPLEPGRMCDAGYCPQEDVESLWREKSRLDELFDAKQDQAYWKARDEIYPQAGDRGGPLGNRAGDKLQEIANAVGGLKVDRLENQEEVVFVDVCGAPGAWSKYLFRMGEEKRCSMKGYGFSLSRGTNEKSCTWFKQDLLSRPNFTELTGADGTGDVCSSENIEHAAAIVGRTADIVVADGGFGVDRGPKGEHMENYQEIVAGSILSAEVRFALETLREGACFICKFFDTFTHVSCGLLFIVAQLFQDVFIVKPLHSRVVNSERYLVAQRFKGITAPFSELLEAVRRLQRSWPRPLTWTSEGPLWVLNPEHPWPDAFLSSLRKMSTTLCRRQSRALQLVLNRACELLREGVTVSEPRKKRRREKPRVW